MAECSFLLEFRFAGVSQNKFSFFFIVIIIFDLVGLQSIVLTLTAQFVL